MNQPGLFGRLVESYRKHNPKQVPTILFAPGVKESIWLADQFNRAGIRAAHIDGDAIWVDGAWTETGPAARKELKEMAESGWVKIVCNRFVMREGLDWPFWGVPSWQRYSVHLAAISSRSGGSRGLTPEKTER